MDLGPIHFPLDLVDALRSAARLAVLTGAGISAESGVPTFREAQTGLWAKYDPQELATPDAFRRNPKLVWDWYAWRRELVSHAEPNPGHLALAELEKQLPSFTLITQNVDGLHQRAGSRAVIELHGNLQRVKCFEDGDPVSLTDIEDQGRNGEYPPRCPRCGGLLRPDVVWFGEILPAANLEKARQAAQNSTVFFSIGTSGVVEPAATLPVIALHAGAMVVEINPLPTPLASLAAYSLQGPAGVILPALVEQVFNLPPGL
jgi:NAD-dependent deacetylase